MIAVLYEGASYPTDGTVPPVVQQETLGANGIDAGLRQTAYMLEMELRNLANPASPVSVYFGDTWPPAPVA